MALTDIQVSQLSTQSDRVGIPRALKTLRDECEAATVKFATFAFGFADLDESDGSQTLDFADALPAGAMVIGAGINCTAIFDNVGDSAGVTADVGISGGNTDGFIDGASLNAVAKVSDPTGTAMGGLVGAITPCVVVAADVNVDTLTKGAATAYVAYVEIP